MKEEVDQAQNDQGMRYSKKKTPISTPQYEKDIMVRGSQWSVVQFAVSKLKAQYDNGRNRLEAKYENQGSTVK